MPRRTPLLLRRSARAYLMLLVVLLLAVSNQARVAIAQTMPVPLVTGWNNFGYLGPAQPVLAALSGIPGQYDGLVQWDAATQRWRTFNPGAPETSDFTDLTQGGAYWIHMLQPVILPVGISGGGGSSRQLQKGWNNVVQANPTAPVRDALASYGAAYASVWHWNAPQQHWDLFDANAPQVSDFQTLIQGQAYFVQVVSPTAGTGSNGPSCYDFQSYQPQTVEVADALNRAGVNALINDPSFQLAAAHYGTGDPALTMPGYIPPTLLKAIAWVESNWSQAGRAVSRGSQGRTITSSACAYGLIQVYTGMENITAPTARQNLIGTDYRYNAAAGAQILLAKWNLAPDHLPVYGRRDPRIIEDWYFAVWAYYGITTHGNPDDPSLKWPRPVYGSNEYKSGPFTVADYPYQELVFGLISNPPTVNGVPLWQSIPVSLPAHGAVGFPTANGTYETSAHLEGGQELPVQTPPPTATPTPGPSPSSTPGPTGTPTPRP